MRTTIINMTIQTASIETAPLLQACGRVRVRVWVGSWNGYGDDEGWEGQQEREVGEVHFGLSLVLNTCGICARLLLRIGNFESGS